MADRYRTTISAVCTACSTTVTMFGGGAPVLPRMRLGERVPIPCTCGAELEGVIVGHTLEPYGVVIDDDD